MTVGLGLVLLGLIEIVCWCFGWGGSGGYVDPGFDPARSLFVTNATGDRLVTRETRVKFFVKESFPVEKEDGVFRVFCLGGSTVQGRPWSIETAFPAWLELSLQAAAPGRRWEVINCGGVSYASYRLTHVLKEVLRYQPDLILLCTGHNEFLEDLTYGAQKNAPLTMVRRNEWLMQFRVYGLLRGVLTGTEESISVGSSGFSDDVDAVLDYRNGLRAYHRDDDWRARVVQRYEDNVTAMVQMARGADVPILLLNPTSNLSDSAPFKSEHDGSLSDSQRIEVAGKITEARKLHSSDPTAAAKLLNEAVAMDELYATSHFELGQVYEGMRRYREAEAAYQRALELDVCPLRILDEMETVLKEVAGSERVRLIDLQALIRERSSHHLVGNEWLVDHIHPSMRGHQLIAETLFDAMIDEGWVTVDEGWKEKRDQLYRSHLENLPDLYYLWGQQRLENLREWTKGQTDGPEWK